ncbi:MAG TPA: hypothetical protein VM537_34410 [Anaerolineae bacterium]|nr:hypothetical protein [Anaerolineae bacterium]
MQTDEKHGLVVADDPTVSEALAGALMDHFGAIDGDEGYQFEIPAGVVRWVEEYMDEYVTPAELGLEPDEEVNDFTTILFTAFFTYLGTVVGNNLIRRGFGPMIKAMGPRAFLAKRATADMAPGLGVLPRYDGIPAIH